VGVTVTVWQIKLVDEYKINYLRSPGCLEELGMRGGRCGLLNGILHVALWVNIGSAFFGQCKWGAGQAQEIARWLRSSRR
jgi:hypothetical protein